MVSKAVFLSPLQQDDIFLHAVSENSVLIIDSGKYIAVSDGIILYLTIPEAALPG